MAYKPGKQLGRVCVICAKVEVTCSPVGWLNVTAVLGTRVMGGAAFVIPSENG